jgi:hypothetical protein
MSACIGEPISWPRLERYALDGGADRAVHEHVAQCAACARCLDEIRGDTVELPPLAVPASATAPTPGAVAAQDELSDRRARRRPRWLAPAMAFAAAAAVALVVWRSGGDDRGERREEVARIKGVGEVVLGVVRKRGDTIRHDARTFAPDDSWKIVVTCPPTAAAWVDVAIYDAGQLDHPLAPAQISCGNRVFLPGAFSLTGARANRVCVRISAGAAPDRAQPPDACVTLRPE